jgi:hypothetical protein
VIIAFTVAFSSTSSDQAQAFAHHCDDDTGAAAEIQNLVSIDFTKESSSKIDRPSIRSIAFCALALSFISSVIKL